MCQLPARPRMELHHRQARQMGGGKGRELDVAANLMWCHSGCHQDAHSHPDRSRALGWIVASWDDFRAVLVQRWRPGQVLDSADA